MSNTYGFDFLKTEHLDESAADDNLRSGSHVPEPLQPGSPTDGGLTTEELFLQARNKPDLEKQFDILEFLKKHRGKGGLAPSVIYKSTGIDLEESIKVAAMLQNNPKISVERWPDPENPSLTVPHYSYQATFKNVRDRTSLLAQINREFNGVGMRDLEDAYAGVEDDIAALVTAGDIIAISNTEDKDRVLFPRGEPFLVELDGLIAIPRPNGKSDGDSAAMPPPAEVVLVDTDVDPRPQIRRGEAVQVGGQWFRVSSAVKAGVPLSEQPSRAQAPLSVVMYEDLSKRNEVDGYIRPLSSSTVPLDAPLSENAQRNVVQARAARERLLRLAHGRSGGVTQQLLGSLAHASNPSTLAASFAGSTASASMRKRPNVKATAGASKHQQQVTKEELEKAASDPSLSLYRHARRHGCTKDIREMYLKTRSLIPESDHELHKLLLEHKLIEPGEELRRKRLGKVANVDHQGKTKKKRYYERKGQRWTNTHLDGTAIGAVLKTAQEKQKQGKSVGDGGM